MPKLPGLVQCCGLDRSIKTTVGVVINRAITLILIRDARRRGEPEVGQVVYRPEEKDEEVAILYLVEDLCAEKICSEACRWVCPFRDLVLEVARGGIVA